MRKIIRMFKQIWNLATPYFLKSDDKLRGWLLLAIDLAIIVITVLATIRMNRWNRDWFNAFFSRNKPLWLEQLKVFIVLGIIMVLTMTLKVYIDEWLHIRWRKWMTSKYLKNWMDEDNHYRMQLSGNITDNPDQRISEDIRMFIQSTIMFSLTLLQQLLTLISFIGILWTLSGTIPLIFGGKDYSFPGYLVLAALVWAVIGTFGVHLVGKPLIRLNFNQQMYEADFRFSLVRVRENSEQIALLKGENVEHSRLMAIFNNVIANWFRIMMRKLKAGLVSGAFSQVDGILISVLIAPAFFSGKVDYGAIMQISMAFMTVLMTFKFFQMMYNGLAEWKAVINRLTGFLEGAKRTEEIQKESKINIKKLPSEGISIQNLDVNLPTGKLQVSVKDLILKNGEKVLIKGRTGAGKTTLFRVLAGIWPFGSGSIVIPKDKKVIVLPQKPYLPIGTLAEAVSYPEPVEAYKPDDIKQALRDVGLEKFVNRLDEVAHWNHLLSGGEQQRVGIARAMLYNPDYLFFDEATASMDEPSEEELYSLLLERMKNTTIISIGHRSSLQKFHKRLIVAEQQPAGNYEFVEQKA